MSKQLEIKEIKTVIITKDKLGKLETLFNSETPEVTNEEAKATGFLSNEEIRRIIDENT